MRMSAPRATRCRSSPPPIRRRRRGAVDSGADHLLARLEREELDVDSLVLEVTQPVGDPQRRIVVLVRIPTLIVGGL